MYINETITLYSGNNNYSLNVYLYKKMNSNMSNTGLIQSESITIYIPQENNSETDLKSLNISAGKDCVTIGTDAKKHTITSYTDAMYGSPNMHHLELII